ncbi:MAG: sigma-70 family RNA polymerase sigma factor [Clostridiales Family XIII bacterium]|nr:sigma-70 family RNA polymerase sigma factor [Clostridiales Family XIII bacterium]
MSLIDDKANMQVAQDEKFRLIEEAQGGDTLAFEKLYARYAQTILFLTRKYLWAQDDVEDVAQDAVLNMLSGIKKLKHAFAFDSWLHSLVRNACHNHNKLSKRIEENEGGDENSLMFLEADDEYVPEASLLKTELDREVMEALQKLPDSYREALYLYYYKQLSYGEIASKLGVTESTVSTNILKGKKKLKEMLEDTSKIDDRGDDVLRGVAFGPALAHAFFVDEVELFANPDEVSNFVKSTNSRIEQQVGSSDATKNIGRKGLPKVGTGAVFAILISTVIVIMAAVFIVNPERLLSDQAIDDVAAPPQAEETVKPSATPKLEIVLQGGDGSTTDIQNPVSATLKTDNGTAEDWRIVDGDGKTVSSGNGSSFTDELSLLPPGEYTIEWKNARDDGTVATATRRIEITT